MTKHHGGTLADAVVEVVPDQAVELPDPATLEARSVAALRAGDASELDLLEEALARQLAGALAPWLRMTRRRWGDGRVDAAADEVLTALAAGRPEPFAPLARTPPHFAAYALSRAGRSAYEHRRALRRALRGATEPLAAPLALALNVACPSLDALYVTEWLDGGPPPQAVASPEAALACRLASIGAPAWPLSPHDPIAVVERALGHAAPPVALADAPDLAVSRALGLSADMARGWLPAAPTRWPWPPRGPPWRRPSAAWRSPRANYEERLITTAERDARLAEVATLARALGSDGAPLREALGD